jgi:hypothetical protein
MKAQGHPGYDDDSQYPDDDGGCPYDHEILFSELERLRADKSALEVEIERLRKLVKAQRTEPSTP